MCIQLEIGKHCGTNYLEKSSLRVFRVPWLKNKDTRYFDNQKQLVVTSHQFREYTTKVREENVLSMFIK